MGLQHFISPLERMLDTLFSTAAGKGVHVLGPLPV